MTTLRKLSLFSAALAASVFATAATAAPVCLQVDRILNTTVGKDTTYIDVHMRDGTVWRNTLRNKCQDLHWYGFVWVMRGPNEVCENLQAIRVIRTGETCLLGPFAKIYDPSQPTQHT